MREFDPLGGGVVFQPEDVSLLVLTTAISNGPQGTLKFSKYTTSNHH